MRKPMVTRTIITTEIVALCMDIEKAEPYNATVSIPRKQPDQKKLLKLVAGELDDDTHKVVAIVSQEEKETIYGMEESEFIKLAHKLDADRKVIDEGYAE